MPAQANGLGLRRPKSVFSPNGAALSKPGAAPQEQYPPAHLGLKARSNLAQIGPGLQPSRSGGTVTRGVAPGWYEAGALPLTNPPTAALDAGSAEVLGNIKALL